MRFQRSFSKTLARRFSFSFVVLTGIVAAMPALVLLAQSQTAAPAPQDLFAAVKSGDASALQNLIAHGADVNAADADGLTPLYLAALRGDTAAAGTLLAAGAKVDLPDNLGMTPLHAAAFGGRDDVVALLLAHGASANPRDKAGMTPLHYAAAGGHDKVVQTLLGAAASPSAVSAEGHTPADLAERNGHSGLAAKLRTAYAPSVSQTTAKATKSPRVITNEDLPNGGAGGEPTGASPQSRRSEPRRGTAPNGARQPQGAQVEKVNDLYAQIDRLSREKRNLENQLPDLRQRCDAVKDSQKQGQSNVQAGPGMVASNQSVQSSRRAEAESEVACRPLRQAENRIQAIEKQIDGLKAKVADLETGSSRPVQAPRTR